VSSTHSTANTGKVSPGTFLRKRKSFKSRLCSPFATLHSGKTRFSSADIPRCELTNGEGPGAESVTPIFLEVLYFHFSRSSGFTKRMQEAGQSPPPTSLWEGQVKSVLKLVAPFPKRALFPGGVPGKLRRLAPSGGLFCPDTDESWARQSFLPWLSAEFLFFPAAGFQFIPRKHSG